MLYELNKIALQMKIDAHKYLCLFAAEYTQKLWPRPTPWRNIIGGETWPSLYLGPVEELTSFDASVSFCYVQNYSVKCNLHDCH